MSEIKITPTGYYGYDQLDGVDDRSEAWKEQREVYGFDTTELWSLGDTIINFSLPRIKKFIEIEKETNINFYEYEEEYLTLIEGLELFVRNDGSRLFTKEEEEKVNEALNKFGGMLPDMWF